MMVVNPLFQALSDHPVLLTDRTTGTTDQRCGMERWWYKEHDGTGIVPVDTPDYFTVGSDIHEDFAELVRCSTESYMRQVLREKIAPGGTPAWDTVERQMDMESLFRRLGWAIAFGHYVVPQLRNAGEVIAVEHEMALERGQLWTAVKPDLITNNHGELVYHEYKTVGGANAAWINHWQKAVQIHLGLAAMRDEFVREAWTDRRLGYGVVRGVEKGYVKDGRLHHPYVWAYRRETDGGVEYSAKYRSGWDPFPVWEYPDGIEHWVLNVCGPAIAAEQFPVSARIHLDERLVEAWVLARTHREEEVLRVREACRTDLNQRMTYFEMRTENCRPTRGRECVYCAACHNAEVNRDPLASGIYKRRVPHHELELIAGRDEP